MKYKINDVAVMVILDITTAHIGEYAHVRVIKIEDNDIFVEDSVGNTAWVTADYLDLEYKL